MNHHLLRDRARRTLAFLAMVGLAAGCASTPTPVASALAMPSAGPASTPSESQVSVPPAGPSESAIDPAGLKGRIAFSAGGPHTEDVYVVNADGTGLRQVTTDPAADFDPSWAPDGSRIAYRHQPGDDSTTEIYLIDADGSNPTNVSRNDERADWGPSWSPDGSVIGWNTQRPGASSGFVLGLIEADGSHVRTVEPGVWVEYVTWSPDGTQISFMSQTPEGTDNYEVIVANADGSDPVQLTNSPGPDGWPTWSPGGTQIAFSSVRDDCSLSQEADCLSTGDIGPFHTVWVMNVDGSNQHRLSRRFVQIPDWSPDGRYLVFGARSGLGILSADGTGYAEISVGLAEPGFPDWIE